MCVYVEFLIRASGFRTKDSPKPEKKISTFQVCVAKEEVTNFVSFYKDFIFLMAKLSLYPPACCAPRLYFHNACVGALRLCFRTVCEEEEGTESTFRLDYEAGTPRAWKARRVAGVEMERP